MDEILNTLCLQFGKALPWRLPEKVVQEFVKCRGRKTPTKIDCRTEFAIVEGRLCIFLLLNLSNSFSLLYIFE